MFVDGIVDYNRRSIDYSDSYFKLKENNTLFTNEMIIGEYCNRAFKYEFGLKKAEDPRLTLKEYRSSEDGDNALSTIRDSVDHFLNEVELLSVKECFPDISKVLDEMATGKIDITDSVIANICLDRNILVMSDDRDLFCKSDLGLITANPWMLKNAKNRDKHKI
jgi:predicted nucleic acid-binding protein